MQHHCCAIPLASDVIPKPPEYSVYQGLSADHGQHLRMIMSTYCILWNPHSPPRIQNELRLESNETKDALLTPG